MGQISHTEALYHSREGQEATVSKYLTKYEWLVSDWFW